MVFLSVDMDLIPYCDGRVFTGVLCLQLQIHIDIQLVIFLACFLGCHLCSRMNKLVVRGKQYWANQLCSLLPWLDPLLQNRLKGANIPLGEGRVSSGVMNGDIVLIDNNSGRVRCSLYLSPRRCKQSEMALLGHSRFLP